MSTDRPLVILVRHQLDVVIASVGAPARSVPRHPSEYF